MSFRDRYGYDKDKAENGTWVMFGDDFEIRIRRASSKAVRELNKKLMKPYSHLTKGGKDLPSDIQDMVTRKLIAGGILLGWKGKGGPTDKEGKLIPWSVEAAEAEFIESPDFMEEVFESSTEIQNFRDEEIEEIEGNS